MWAMVAGEFEPAARYRNSETFGFRAKSGEALGLGNAKLPRQSVRTAKKYNLAFIRKHL